MAKSAAAATARRELPAPAVTLTAAATEPLTPRISIQLTTDGAIDWEGMRGASRERLVKLVQSDPKFRANGDTRATSDPALTAQLAPALAAIYGALGTIEAAIVQRATRCTPDQAAVFHYSETEKTMLVDPTLRVVAKYAPDFLHRFGDEMMLATLLASIGVQKWTTLQQMMMESARPSVTHHPRVVPIAPNPDTRAD